MPSSVRRFRLGEPLRGSCGDGLTAAGHPYCILCAKNSEMLNFVPPKNPWDLVSKRGMEATLTMHGAKYANMPNSKTNPFTPPGDTRATSCQSFSPSRLRVQAQGPKNCKIP